MSTATQITESALAFGAFTEAVWVFREGCKKHWWKFSLSVGINTPDQRLTKAEKVAVVPADADAATETRSAFDAALRKAS